MNERIRDLKEQALIWAVETLDPDVLNDNEWGVAIDAKFAELIIRECTANVKDWEKDSRNHISYMLERHFGVEE